MDQQSKVTALGGRGSGLASARGGLPNPSCILASVPAAGTFARVKGRARSRIFRGKDLLRRICRTRSLQSDRMEVQRKAKNTGGGGAFGLEEAERLVVEHRGSPLLVLGGPGTGKTTLLEKRYLALCSEAPFAPHRILYLCNNRTYSAEARDRLFWQIPNEASIEIPVYTWHALANHLVSRYYMQLGYREPPVLLTGPEQWGVVKELLSAEDRSGWGSWSKRISDHTFVDEVADFCLRVQQRMMAPQDLAQLAQARPDWARVVTFAGRYRSFLHAEARLDYAGLISEAVRLLSENPEVQASLTARFPHVLVDDAQEMSQAHVSLLEALGDSTICVAADPDSGIEKFRGAEPDWTYGFEAKFAKSKTVLLRQSRRIGAPLGPALAKLLAQNEPDDGHRPIEWAPDITEFECRVYRSLWEELEAIACEFRNLHLSEGIAYSQMAVLLSQPRRLLPGIERAFRALDVPLRAVFPERSVSAAPAVAAFLDLARFAVKAPMWQESLPRLLTSPLIGLDFAGRRRLEREAWRTGRTLADVAEESPDCSELRTLRDVVVNHSGSADECFWAVWCAAGYFKALADAARGGTLEDPGVRRQPPALEAELAETLNAVVAFNRSLVRFVERRRGAASISEFLNEAARADFGSDPWLSPQTLADPAVTISSFHWAKGKQWDYVAVAGCVDSWIPKGTRAQGLFDPFALETPDIADRQIEALADDRRTFYVAASRARRKVIFTASAPAGGRGRPSRFLTELGGELPEPSGPPALPPLTLSQLVADLRKTIVFQESAPADRVAALAALAQVPGIRPSAWYGVRDWTPGSVPLVEGKLQTSYSRLSPFENCGLQYLLQSVLGLDRESTYSMKFGTWLHALFEAVHNGRINEAAVLQTEYEKLFDEKIFPNATIARQFRKDGERMLKVFWENEVDSHTVKCEHPFTDIEAGGASIRGRIDRVDLRGKALKLTDYKTARWAPSFREAERSLQLAIYHLAARKDPELSQLGHPEIARLVYPGALSKTGRYQVLNQTAEQADKVLEQLPGMIRRVLDEDFRPNPEADCYFCRMKPLCPLWPAGREVPS